jgi:subtilisin family serine protease
MSRLSSGQARRPRHTVRALRNRLDCERLEDRTLLSTGGPLPTAFGPPQLDLQASAPSAILVRFRDEAAGLRVAGAGALQGTEVGPALPLVPGLREVHLDAGLGVDAALAAYRADPDVLYAEPDYRIQLQRTPNDPQYPTEWDLNNTGQTGGTPDADIDAPEAWDTTTGSGRTTVAVIDTGIDYNHPDLYANVWINQAEIPPARRANLIDVDGDGLITFADLNDPRDQGPGKITDQNGDGRITAADILARMQGNSGGWADGVSEDGDTAHVDDLVGWNFVNNTNNPMDDNDHGTHVSGTIGAVGDNGVGVTGINWHVRLMGLKFLDANGSGTTSGAIAALNYAVAHGAAVSNNSYGGDPFSQAFFDAIRNARDAGHIFVAAAGNGNFLGIGQNNDTTPFYPANYALANVVSVAATDATDTLAGFSNYGATTVDLAAPGVNILSTTRNNTYSRFDGTSMATPHVTGVLALVRDLNPTWTYSQVINKVLGSVDPVPGLQGKTVTGGRLNAARAVQPPPVIDLNWSGGGITGPVTADAQTPFTVSRTYTITGEAARTSFAITYYASTDPVFGNADDVLLGTETLSTAADWALGAHAGTSPALQITVGGTFYLFAKVDGTGSIFETDETNNVAQAPQPVVVTGPVIVDNGQPGYTEGGTGWQAWSSGYGGGLRYHSAGTGADTATWQATGLAPGYYLVQATWNGDNAHASNAPYSIYDGTALLQTILVNQKAAPSGPVVGGVAFQNLATVRLTSSTLKVVLSDNANGDVVADAVRLVPVPPPVIDLNWSGGGISGPAAADTQTAFTVSRTYSVTGEPASADFTIAYYRSTDAVFGNADDVLLATETITAAADKAVGVHAGTSPALQITVGGTFYLFAKVDGSGAILESNEGNNIAQAAQPVTVTVPVIVDNGQAGYAEGGTGWQAWGSGYGGGLRYHAAGTGADTATWQATGLAAGYYTVQATWNGDSNHASNAPYSIYDGSTLLLTVRVDQRPNPSGTVVGGVAFQNLAAVQLASGTLKVVLSDDATGYVVADAVRLVPLPPPTVDLNWSGGGLSGPSTADAGTPFTLARTYTVSGTPAPADFTIAYYASTDAVLGNADDVLLGTETITAAADKAVGSHPGSSPALQFATGGVYYVFARLDSAGTVLETDEGNNVAQAPQQVAVRGPVVVDNAQPGYTEAGSGWLAWSAGYAGGLRYHAAGTGANTATWQATGLAPGYYTVQATWNGDFNHASNAPYTIYDGTTLLQTVRVDQRANPSGTVVGGVAFQDLAAVQLTSGTLKVVLSDDAGGYVVADAVRLVPLPPPTVDLNWTGGGLTGPSAADAGTSFTLSRTYTVTGTAAPADFKIAYYVSTDAVFGNADDVLLATETVTAAADKAVGSHAGSSPALQIANGGTYYLFAQVDSGNAILETAEGNNVAQAPQALVVRGPIILDNGQAGYTEAGTGWQAWGSGYGGGLRYHAAGTGADTATWQAAGLAAGYYTVQATWNGDFNHAANAPYSLYDGATLLLTVRVDQRANPSGTVVGGVAFQDLAAVQLTSGTLRVVLSDDAGGYVVADAVRLVPLPPPTVDLNWIGGGLTGPSAADAGTSFTLSRTYTVSGTPAPADFTIAYYASADAVLGNADDVLLGTETITAAADKAVGSHAGTSPALQFATGGVYYLFARIDSTAAVLEIDEGNNVAQAPQQVAVRGPVIVDNAQPGYSESGTGWLAWGAGYAGGLRYHAAGTGANTATWQATGLAAGYYTVQATWNGDFNHATTAPYSIYDGTTLLQTVLVNQRLNPSGTVLGGVAFQDLATVLVTSGTLQVVLSDNADGYVVADAIRLVPASPPGGPMAATSSSKPGSAGAGAVVPLGGTASGDLLAAVQPSGAPLGFPAGPRLPAAGASAGPRPSSAVLSSGADVVAALLAARLERRPFRGAAPHAGVSDWVFAVIGEELLSG